MNHRRFGEAAQRATERRRREDEAERLRNAVPKLDSLRLEIEERRMGGVVAEASHIRRIVVESAPALFVLPCLDRECKEGGTTSPTPSCARCARGRCDSKENTLAKGASAPPTAGAYCAT